MTDKQAPHNDGLGQLGGYRLLSELGVGAAGQVYLAQQSDPAREVAIKVLRSASAAGRQRFEREVSLLAGLEHTNIARLYDAGTEAGPAGEVPYLVMEYVRGQDLIAYAQTAALSTAQRLALMAQVARAAHFAHTRGVIHRDLKPANILVNEHGEPKILDFGVAHVTADDATQMTGAGEILGTLAYMSWEQLCGEAKQVDARSDVYALGAIAYELLSGELPYPGLRSDTLVSALGRMQREAPRKLSAHLPAARGDIETLVMKALSQDAAQRYGSAAEFAADIERYLKQQPIEARPPTLGYVLGLFVRRHKALSTAAGLALASLIAAVAVSLSFAISESQARAAAEGRLAEREAVTQFLIDMLTTADPSNALGRKLTVLEVLDSARAELTADQQLPTDVRSQLQRALGLTYVALGESDQGLTLLEPAYSTMAAATGDASAAAQRAAQDWIWGLTRDGQEERALAELERVSSTAQQLPADIALHTSFLRAYILSTLGRYAEVIVLLEPSYQRSLATLGATAPTTVNIGNELARALQRESRFDESLEIANSLLNKLQEQLGAVHPRLIETQEIIALATRESGQFEASVPLFEAIYEQRLAVQGPAHPDTNIALINLSSTLSLADHPAQGLPLAIKSHEQLRTRLGDEAGTTKNAASLRAYVAGEAGEFDEAARAYQSILEIAEQATGGITTNDLPDYNNLGNIYRRSSQLDRAQTVFETLMQHADRLLAPDHPHYGLFESNYAEILRLRGEHAQAIVRLRHALANNEAAFGSDHPASQRTAKRLAAAEAGNSQELP